MLTSPTVTLTRRLRGEAESRVYPGFNCAQILWELGMHRQLLILDYQEIGYEKVPLLNATDRKRIVALWGEPRTHRDPLDFYRLLWDAGRELFTRQIEAHEEESTREWAQLIHGETPARLQSPSEPAAPRKRWWWPFG